MLSDLKLQLLCLILSIVINESFVIPPTITRSATSTSSLILNTFNQNNKNEDNDEWDFNPFEKKSIQQQKITSSIFISPRKQKMDTIVMDLYRCNNDNALMNDILNKSKDFLLQPFEDDNFESDLESDSIYDKDMSREEKINKYKNVMIERIDNAKNGEVKIVLRTMMEFILEKTSI